MIDISAEVQRGCEAATEKSPVQETDSYQLFDAQAEIGDGAIILWKTGHDFPSEFQTPGMLLPITIKGRQGYLATMANAKTALSNL